MKVTTMGIDLAKNVFQVHGVEANGRVVLNVAIKRAKLMQFIAQQAPCLIGLEACGSSHYWARRFREHGHEVKLMAPQYVKPFVKTNKSDRNDAEAICEAVRRPNMHFVPIKNIASQEIQCLHRIRSRLIKSRTALANEVRGLLSEFGIIIPLGIYNVRKAIPEILADAENELSTTLREVFSNMYQEYRELSERIKLLDECLIRIFRSNETCQRLSKIEGVGILCSTALVAAVPDPKVFKNGRQMAAWLGVVPRQSSSGGHQRLLGISKRRDRYIRTLLIHGARAVVAAAVKKNKSDCRSRWIIEKEKTRGPAKTAVAVANKTLRIIWAMLSRGEEYRIPRLISIAC